MKKEIRLTESKIREIIRESIYRILKEDTNGDPFAALGIDRNEIMNGSLELIADSISKTMDYREPDYKDGGNIGWNFELDPSTDDNCYLVENDELGLTVILSAKGTVYGYETYDKGNYDTPPSGELEINDIELEFAEISFYVDRENEISYLDDTTIDIKPFVESQIGKIIHMI